MKREIFFALCFFTLVTLLFFYPIFKGFIPFPGDLLVGNYSPYSSYPFMGYAPGGYPHKGQNFDVLQLLYPAKEFAIQGLKNAEFPLWNPYNFSGNPHLASLQSGTFYPLNIIFWLFSFETGWLFYIVIQPILSGFFAYLFLRGIKLGRNASLFGAIVFSFSSYFIVWIEYGNIGHTILWQPLAMWLALKNLEKPTLHKSFFLAAVLSFSILAGYIQLAIYIFTFVLAFVVFYVIFVEKTKKLIKLCKFIPIFVLPLCISAVQLVPSIELFINSARTPYDLESFLKLLIPQFHLITTFVPDFFGNPATRNYWLSGTYIERVSYIGVLPLFFAIYGFIGKRTPFVWFFAGSLLVVFFLVYDSIFTKAMYSIYIPPIISTGVPSRIMYIFCFAGSILAATGFNEFEKKIKLSIVIRTIIAMGSVYSLLWVFVLVAPFQFEGQSWITNLSVSKRNLILPTIIFFMSMFFIFSTIISKKIRKYMIVGIMALTIFDLFYFFHKITPFSPKESLYPDAKVLSELRKIQGIDRSWGYGSGHINPNIQTHETIFSTDGYDALHIRRYGEFVGASKDGRIFNNPARSEAEIIQGFGEDDLRNNIYRQKMLNILGVKYLLHKITPYEIFLPDYKTFPEDTYSLLWQKDSWQIYENRNSLPRAFLLADYIVINEKQKIVDAIMDQEFDPSSKVILEENPDIIILKQDPNAAVDIKSYTPNKIVLTTRAKENMLLFLSDTYFPGWNVTIDGKNDKIYRANYSFRAVPVKKGTHQVVFSYFPESFDIGLKISILSISLSLLFIAGAYVKKKIF